MTEAAEFLFSLIQDVSTCVRVCPTADIVQHACSVLASFAQPLEAALQELVAFNAGRHGGDMVRLPAAKTSTEILRLKLCEAALSELMFNGKCHLKVAYVTVSTYLSPRQKVKQKYLLKV